MKSIEIIVIIVICHVPIVWVWNMAKLFSCDFEPNYKCEIVHGIGILPLVSLVTVFADDDGK